MGDKSDLPVYPGHGAVTHAQRDSAELARIRIRQNQRQLRDDDSVDVQNAPPLPVYNRALLEAHRAEKVARTRRQEQTVRLALRDKHRLTRTIAGELEKEFEEESGGGQDAGRWEARALNHMFGKGGEDPADRALSEVIAAFDEADENLLPLGAMTRTLRTKLQVKRVTTAVPVQTRRKKVARRASGRMEPKHRPGRTRAEATKTMVTSRRTARKMKAMTPAKTLVTAKMM
ncbi:hypothetical protein PF002_g897 [Phytophthora fragariae]|uniref:Uncharacterized protein n=1 Tax=Phytophthora fragariae TaxID=53985 RepID=A0A6A3MCP7_9STRA|nr:hypothetical protein PF003_g22364 [Phytophthora fragariae]KAE8948550.1 hypothetical protein PF009_g1869 [Phytophthora fragariae]KAE9028557.1 hypothetical protein PF011_g1503 [Phytophthora fragariae]KAE9257573.1 hypothetical protein PF002_g897 [Phytophthora fragariae]